MNGLMQSEALFALLRGRRDKEAARSTASEAVADLPAPLQNAEPSAEPHAAMPVPPQTSPSTATASIISLAGTTPQRPGPPPRFEVDLGNSAFASVFGLGKTRAADPPPQPAAPEPSVVQQAPGTIDLAALNALNQELSKLPLAEPPLDLQASRLAGFKVRDMNDLQALKGIGPKTLAVLNAAGIDSFADLANATPHELHKILSRSGASFRLARPAEWIVQAGYAACNHWQACRDWQSAHRRQRKPLAPAA